MMTEIIHWRPLATEPPTDSHFILIQRASSGEVCEAFYNHDRKTIKIDKITPVGCELWSELPKGMAATVPNGLDLLALQDIRGAKQVSVKSSADRKTLWINVDGHCVLRCSDIEQLEIPPPF